MTTPQRVMRAERLAGGPAACALIPWEMGAGLDMGQRPGLLNLGRAFVAGPFTRPGRRVQGRSKAWGLAAGVGVEQLGHGLGFFEARTVGFPNLRGRLSTMHFALVQFNCSPSTGEL